MGGGFSRRHNRPFWHPPFSEALSSSHPAHHGHSGHSVLFLAGRCVSQPSEGSPQCVTPTPGPSPGHGRVPRRRPPQKSLPGRALPAARLIPPLLQPVLRLRHQPADPLAGPALPEPGPAESAPHLCFRWPEREEGAGVGRAGIVFSVSFAGSASSSSE